MPQVGACPATQACALTGNRACDLSVQRLALSPLSHTSLGCCFSFMLKNWRKPTETDVMTVRKGQCEMDLERNKEGEQIMKAL